MLFFGAKRYWIWLNHVLNAGHVYRRQMLRQTWTNPQSHLLPKVLLDAILNLSNSSLLDLEHHPTPRLSQSTWDTTSTCRLKISKVSHPSSLQLLSCAKSSTAMLAVSVPVWSALVGTHTKATRSTVLIRQDSSKNRKCASPVLAVPSSMVTKMQTGNPACLLTKQNSSLRVRFL